MKFFVRKHLLLQYLAQNKKLFPIFAGKNIDNPIKEIMKKLFFLGAAAFLALTAEAQTVDPNNEYLVWTKNVKLEETKEEAEEKADSTHEQKTKSFENKYFVFRTMCNWEKGMKFMVLPEKKDMVIRTFTNAKTGKMAGNMSLRHKIMVYQGHSGEGLLHEHVDFYCIDDSTHYYYEVPTSTFDEHCLSKMGVPTLAYLGDVDIARRELIGKTLLTTAEEFNIDKNTSGFGYEKISVPEGTPVKVVAIGVGTRQFPVKIIVEDVDGRQFFQNVAFSRINSGLRDDEFEVDNFKHNFHGSFALESDNPATGNAYRAYIGKNVYTLYPTRMINSIGTEHNVQRLTPFNINRIAAKLGTRYVTLFMTDKEGNKWTKDVTFENKDVAGDIDGKKEDYFFYLFAEGDTRYIRDVREENMDANRKGFVRPGFTEAEVRLALGEPDGKGTASNGTVYTWAYTSSMHAQRCTVYFLKKTKTVKAIQQ